MTIDELKAILDTMPGNTRVFLCADHWDLVRSITSLPEAKHVTPCLTGGNGRMAVTVQEQSEYWNLPAIVIS